MTSVEFLGHNFDINGVKLSDSRLLGINESWHGAHLKAISLGDSWAKTWIGECGICQKIKYQRSPDWEDQVENHLYSLSSLTSLSVDTLGENR
jgi:hypothetical protein